MIGATLSTLPAHALQADGRAQDVSGEALQPTHVPLVDPDPIVDGEAGVAPGEQELGHLGLRTCSQLQTAIQAIFKGGRPSMLGKSGSGSMISIPPSVRPILVAQRSITASQSSHSTEATLLVTNI